MRERGREMDIGRRKRLETTESLERGKEAGENREESGERRGRIL